MNKKFKNKDALKIGWQKTKENFWFLVAIQLVVYAINALIGSSILGFLVSILTGFVLTQVFFRLSLGNEVNFKNLFSWLSIDKCVHYILATIIVSVFTFIGFALLVVPGIIVAIMTSFVAFILLEKENKPTWAKASFWQAIKDSISITKGSRWRIFLFFIVALLVNILGIIALGIGILVTIPVTAIAFAHIYNELKKHHHKTDHSK